MFESHDCVKHISLVISFLTEWLDKQSQSSSWNSQVWRSFASLFEFTWLYNPFKLFDLVTKLKRNLELSTCVVLQLNAAEDLTQAADVCESSTAVWRHRPDLSGASQYNAEWGYAVWSDLNLQVELLFSVYICLWPHLFSGITPDHKTPSFNFIHHTDYSRTPIYRDAQ